MDAIPERVLEVWWAYYQCEPFGSHWEQIGVLASTIHAGNTLTAAMRGVEMQPFKVADFMPSDSMPWHKRSKIKRRGIRNPKIQATIMQQAFGFR